MITVIFACNVLLTLADLSIVNSNPECTMSRSDAPWKRGSEEHACQLTNRMMQKICITNSVRQCAQTPDEHLYNRPLSILLETLLLTATTLLQPFFVSKQHNPITHRFLLKLHTARSTEGGRCREVQHRRIRHFYLFIYLFITTLLKKRRGKTNFKRVTTKKNQIPILKLYP